jgi:hypothetical protein
VRLYKRKPYKQYLVKWKGYPERENSWEWEDTLKGASNIVNAYWRSLENEPDNDGMRLSMKMRKRNSKSDDFIMIEKSTKPNNPTI